MNTPQPRSFEEGRRRAHAALRAGRAATAERLLRALEAQFPGEVNCQWLLGVALLDQDKVAESVACSRACWHAPPSSPTRGWTWRVPTAAPAAPRRRAKKCGASSQTMPHHHRAWLAYGDVLVDLDQYREAAVAFERARLTDPYRPQIEAATAALVADERRKAEELFRGILQEDPSHVAALCGLAALSLAADRAHDTERLLRHALKQSAYVPLAYRGLGTALHTARAPEGGRSCRASSGEDRAGQPADLGHDRRRSDAAHAPGGGAASL